MKVQILFPELRQKAKFCAIPSTSGTATEVTAFSVITNYQTGVKYPLADFNITPDVAIVDPDLVAGLPVKQVAYTGMDALTHAIEAYVSTLNGPFTDPLALQAIEMVLDYLPASYNCNMDAREQMHYAQCLAGMAFSNALLGIVHSMAHKTGAAFSTGHIPHGCANAIYLPYVIQYNAKDSVAAKRYAEIARRMGLEGNSEKALINSLVAKIDEFNAKLNIPKTLKDFGINEEEFKEKIAKISELAVGDALDYVVKWLNDYFEFYGEAKVSCDDNGWIPVQGRLPEDNHKGIYDMQLVTLEDGEVCMGVYNNREKEWWTRKQEGERWYTNKHNVIAWQPLPEPYKEEKKC